MRSIEPSLAALGLMGAITAHQGWCKLFTENEPPYPNDQQAVSAYAAILLNGLLPGRGGAAAAAEKETQPPDECCDVRAD